MQQLFTINLLYEFELGQYILFFNKFRSMGNACTGKPQITESQKCLHKNQSRKKKIKTGFEEKSGCELCKIERQQTSQAKQQSLELKQMLSLTTQNIELPQNQKKYTLRTSKKKTINDFEVVRGLGRGAYGKVYMIKDKESSLEQQQECHPQKQILSLDVGEQMQNELQSLIQINLDDVKKYQSEQSENCNKSNLKSSSSDSKNKQASTSKMKNSRLSNLYQTLKSVREEPQYYALKVLSKQQIKSSKQKKQAFCERYILQSMDHPFIVKLYYAFQTNSRLFLIVDLLPGGELFYLLRKYQRFNEEITRFYAAEILLALQYLHQKSIIYRDLKPENILLDKEGHIRITDFGLSKVMYSSSEMTYSMCGTPEYIAPEVIMGGGYTQAADWFSFGSILYDMLTGRSPFLSNNKHSMLKNLVTKSVPLPYYLSEDSKSLLSGLFKINPKDRLGFREGATEIKQHKFFQSINFDDLLNKKINPPISFLKQFQHLQQTSSKVSQGNLINSAGFEKWHSWNKDTFLHSDEKHEKHQNFDGFTFEKEEQHLDFQDDFPQDLHLIMESKREEEGEKKYQQ